MHPVGPSASGQPGVYTRSRGGRVGTDDKKLGSPGVRKEERSTPPFGGGGGGGREKNISKLDSRREGLLMRGGGGGWFSHGIG